MPAPALENAILMYVADQNTHPKLFVWVKSADHIWGWHEGAPTRVTGAMPNFRRAPSSTLPIERAWCSAPKLRKL